MSSQFNFWPITMPEDNPNVPKPADSSFNPVPQPAPPRTRTRKSTAKQAAPKRPPQRARPWCGPAGASGSELMEQAGETDPRQVVLPQMLVGSYASQAGSGGGLLPSSYPVRAMGPPGYMGRSLAPQAPEPPSTQMMPRFLLPPRKKRFFGKGLMYDNMDGANHMEIDLTANMTPPKEFMASKERRKVSPAERQTREYQFFPTCGGDLAERAFPVMADASMSAPSTTAYPSQPIDLSLKLFF